MRRVAITGFGVVSPVGNDRECFWSNLAAGRSGIGRITRFDCARFEVQLAGEVHDLPALPEHVAALAAQDPKIGFGFEACRQALAEAGLTRLNEHALLVLGTSLESFDLERAVIDGHADFRALAERILSGADPHPLKLPLDTTAQMVADEYGRPRQALTNCSACAAGAQAIGQGFRRVRAGDFEVAVCGGFDSMVNPLGVGGFQLLGALTTENDLGPLACRPFDAQRSGTVLGEGAAVFVLEPLERASAEGKRILAEVCGYGSSLDAYTLSAPDPDGDGAERAMRAALADGGLVPEAIGHINTHGTGTRLNDEIEAAAIRRVFDRCWERIPVAATKSVTGHLIAAAGAVEAGACLLTLQRGLVPPHPALTRVGPGCELAHVTEHALSCRAEYALSNSFGFGGQNAALILRSAL